ncbi:unnamed protein product, partial [Porites evermanni]
CLSSSHFWFHFHQKTEKLNTVKVCMNRVTGFIHVVITISEGKGLVIDAYSIWFNSGRLTKTSEYKSKF